ncbi:MULTISPECIES: glycosyltransferase [unclassified Geodermatophilus]
MHSADEEVTDEAVGAGTWCCEFELSNGGGLRSVLEPAGQQVTRVLVRLHGVPLGYVTLPLASGVLDDASLVETARRRYGDRIDQHLAEEGMPSGPDGQRPDPASEACPDRVVADELVSVVVCTRNRSSILAACLERLAALTYPRLEILVVDNAPSDESTRDLVEALAAEDDRFRYVREPAPGLSRARNAGLAAARGARIAYTDDDVAVDADWVQGLVKGFQRRPDVGCVTGLVCTASITGPAEEYFDARAATWSTRCDSEVFDLRSRPGDALYPYAAGMFGTGANFAFDREFLIALGGFDPALGAGSPTRGGEDLDAFVRVLRAGRAIAYEPAAIVWHHHRSDPRALLDQLYGYGTGLSAFATKCIVDPETRWDVLQRIPHSLVHMVAIKSRTDERLGARSSRPNGVLRRELTGLASGPALYLRARRRRSQETTGPVLG